MFPTIFRCLAAQYPDFDLAGVRRTPDTGSFNWSTKNAVFNGNVIVNGEPKNGEVIYNVREKVFVN